MAFGGFVYTLFQNLRKELGLGVSCHNFVDFPGEGRDELMSLWIQYHADVSATGIALLSRKPVNQQYPLSLNYLGYQIETPLPDSNDTTKHDLERLVIKYTTREDINTIVVATDESGLTFKMNGALFERTAPEPLKELAADNKAKVAPEPFLLELFKDLPGVMPEKS